MAKIVFVQPPNPFLTSPTMYFPLGLLYVAAAAEEAKHEVSIVDLREGLDLPKLLQVPKADFYGITATTSLEIHDAATIGRLFKSIHPTSKIILGGPHASLYPEECLAADFDIVVVGDGEQAIHYILDGKIGDGIVHGDPVDLDSLPYPARHLLPYDAVFSTKLFEGEKYGEGPLATTVISSRGCTFNCAFCAQPHSIRYRSPESFVNEIKFLQDRFNCHHFRIVDDAFTLAGTRLLEICRLLEPLKIHYRAQTRADRLSAEMCLALRKSGCDELAIGIESADDDVLKAVNKNETVEDFEKAIALIKEAGMRVKVYWMAGLPKETWNTIIKNEAFMVKTKPHRWTLSMFAPYPGCDIQRNPEKYGVTILDEEWSHYSNFSTSFIKTDVASQEELNEHYRHFDAFLRSEEWRKKE